MVKSTDGPAMTIAVDLGCKAIKQTKMTFVVCSLVYMLKFLGRFYCKQGSSLIRVHMV